MESEANATDRVLWLTPGNWNAICQVEEVDAKIWVTSRDGAIRCRISRDELTISFWIHGDIPIRNSLAVADFDSTRHRTAFGHHDRRDRTAGAQCW